MARQEEYFHGPVLNLPYCALTSPHFGYFLGISSGQHGKDESTVRPEDFIPVRSNGQNALHGTGRESKEKKSLKLKFFHTVHSILISSLLHRLGFLSSLTFREIILSHL